MSEQPASIPPIWRLAPDGGRRPGSFLTMPPTDQRVAECEVLIHQGLTEHSAIPPICHGVAGPAAIRSKETNSRRAYPPARFKWQASGRGNGGISRTPGSEGGKWIALRGDTHTDGPPTVHRSIPEHRPSGLCNARSDRKETRSGAR